jgi:branched-subunit amino acid aminotransferase/4-amino-4-deoxychorismate lyase
MLSLQDFTGRIFDMAGFEGVKWADKQFRYLLKGKAYELMEANASVPAVSRSIHYGLCLAFEGIRFYCKRSDSGNLEVVFLNLDKNLERFERGIAFNLSSAQQEIAPAAEELEAVLLQFFREPDMKEFLGEMADLNAQGYLRPFTFDEEQSIGVTFPGDPSIRGVACRYDRYLGEPFSGVVVPHMVRAVGINGTGCLKLGINYLMSVKAVDEARKVLPEAGSALFLDDNPQAPLEARRITEWDSSCCLFALRDGTVVKIPESNLILPSVTIQGICAILRQMGVVVEERDMTYGELIQRSQNQEVVAICSVGTAGILNRAERLLLVDKDNQVIGIQEADESHELYRKIGQARTYFWDIYQEKVPLPDGLKLQKFGI